MTDKIDMSLDDIIKQNKGKYRPSRVGGDRSSGRGKRRANIRNRQQRRNSRSSPYSRPTTMPDKWQHDLYDGGSQRTQRDARTRITAGVTKLSVTNLNYSVSDADIKELFVEFGPLRKAAVNYDRSGRSLGSADVIFERHEDALKAMKQYNKVPLDGMPMSIAVASSALPLASPRQRKSRNTYQNTSRQSNIGDRRARGLRANRSKKQPTAEELDAELDAYAKKME